MAWPPEQGSGGADYVMALMRGGGASPAEWSPVIHHRFCPACQRGKPRSPL
ncbi:hypothetical protein IG631_02176 [Alternaria alternata]|nr:hypothetical protein IG631_02176 [Alternaria alternata]